ncbi:helix-turn-helix transcriptional regulator [Phaeacidiphilus oryzae]|jgi:two-component system response regulator DesR|uniref:helix-turn-helix transcriptional regulator n=1 Tax=Phaeacidiphilus oryzae TaxID=348818 RepID=UPI00055C4A35|nr:response regulator transcription factor [Phaeacidiphilus oryzae]
MVLGQDSELTVRGVSGKEARERARSLRPEVCVVDAECVPPRDLAALGDTAGALLALVPAGRPGLLAQAAQAHAQGYADKDTTPERLLEGIRKVADGESYVDGALAPSFLRAATTRMPLTPRELSVLELAAQGATAAEIAQVLHLALGTVRNYLSAAARKIGARNRVDAVRLCHQQGWL